MLHNAIITVGNLAVGYLAVGLMRAAYEARARALQGQGPVGQADLRAPARRQEALRVLAGDRGVPRLPVQGQLAVEEGFPGDLKTSLGAKIFATEMAVTHTAEMVEVLGGYGISKEYPVEKYARDAKLLHDHGRDQRDPHDQGSQALVNAPASRADGFRHPASLGGDHSGPARGDRISFDESSGGV